MSTHFPPGRLLALGITLASLNAAHAAVTRAADGYIRIPELESQLPAEPRMPAHVCTTLKASLTQQNGRLPYEVDASPARSSPDGARLQKAIDDCPSGQAVKLITDKGSNAFLSGPFSIKSGVTLWVDKGVTLFASRSPRDYDVSDGPDAGYCGTADRKHKNGCGPWISAIDTVNSGIVGDGVIDARGGAVLSSGPNANRATWWDLSIQSKAKPALKQNNPRMLQVTGGKHFTLYRITLTNAAKFHVGTERSDDMVAWGLKIITPSLAYSVPGYKCPRDAMPVAGEMKISTCFQPENAKNTDGFDPGDSSHVTLAYSFISTGDDNVAIKSGAMRNGTAPSNNHLYAHNHFYYGHGMSVGSETDSGLKNLKVWDLVTDGQNSTHGLGIRIKTNTSRGGNVHDVLYRNVCMRGVAQPLVFSPYYSPSKSKHLLPNIHDITLQDVHVTGAYKPDASGGTLIFSGFSDEGVTNPLTITLNNVFFDTEPGVDTSTYHDVQFTLGAGTNLQIPQGQHVTVRTTGGKAAPLDCPADVFTKFPSPISPI